MTAATGGTLGILAGGGELPLRVARAARNAGRPVFAVVLSGWGDPAQWAGLPHAVERPGAAGRILSLLRGAGVRQLVLAGRARRPSVPALRPDAFGLRVQARLGSAFRLGDHGLLRAGARVLDEEGLVVVGPQPVLIVGLPARLVGFNKIGLLRRGATRDQLRTLRLANALLFRDPGEFAAKVDTAAERFGGEALLEEIIAFIRDPARRRQLVRPGRMAAPELGGVDEENGDGP